MKIGPKVKTLFSAEKRIKKKAPIKDAFFFVYGRGKGIRTPDILLPKQARYRTALYPGLKLAP